MKVWVAAAVAAALLATGAAAPAQAAGVFDDTAGSVHEADIEALAAAGITRGCNPPDNTRFCPDQPVTRGQMAAFLVRALKLQPAASDTFRDDNGSVFEADIEALAAAGITRGCNPPDNTRFCPDQPVTRGQMAAFLVRALREGGAGGGGGGSGGSGSGGERPGELTVYFLDVRQGDAALYVGACGEVGLIDANRHRKDEILAALDRIGTRRLEWIVVSHYDADHLGAVVDVADAPGVTVGAVYDRGGDRNAHDSNLYKGYYDWATGSGKRRKVAAGDVITLCDGADQVKFRVISPNADGTVGRSRLAVVEENDRSVCLHIEYHAFDVASCGDINGTDRGDRRDVESALAAQIGEVDVVKVNHHGSRYSSNPTWVNTLRADVAVISVGKNAYGHPAPEVVTRWKAAGAEVYQTGSTTTSGGHVDGDVVITTTGSGTFVAEGTHSGRRTTHKVDN